MVTVNISANRMMNIGQLLLNYHLRMGFTVPCNDFMEMFKADIKNDIKFEIGSYNYRDYEQQSCYYKLLPINVYIRVRQNNQNMVFLEYVKTDERGIAQYKVEQLYAKEKPPRPMQQPNSLVWGLNIDLNTMQLMEQIRNDICSIIDVQ